MGDFRNSCIQKMKGMEFVKWNISMTASDPSAILLLITNLAVIFFYIKDDWNGLTLILSVVVQGMISIFFQLFGMSLHRGFPKGGLYLKSRPNDPHTRFGILLRGLAVLAGISLYNGFWLLILIFIFSGGGAPDYKAVLDIAIVFIISQMITLLFNQSKDFLVCYKEQGINTIVAGMMPFYAFFLFWIVLIPYIGIVVFTLFRTIFELLIHNSMNTTMADRYIRDDIELRKADQEMPP